MPRIQFPQRLPARYHLPDDHFQRRPSTRRDGLCTQSWLVYPFRHPETAEAQLWPMNAKLYGFEERYPSIDKPLNPKGDTWSHPVWDNEHLKRVGGGNWHFPAFMYTHDDLRHGLYTMYTDWIVVDKDTKEIELKECWACRRKGRGDICLIKGRRILPRDPTNPDSRYRILPPNGGGGNGGGGNGGGGNGGGGNGGHGGGSGRRGDDGDEDEDDGDDRDGGRHGDGYDDEEEKPDFDKQEEYDDDYSGRDPFGYMAELYDELEEETENARAGPSTGPGTAGDPGLRRGGPFQRLRPYTVINYGDYELVDLTGETDDEDDSEPYEPRSSESASSAGSKRKSEDSDPGQLSTLTKRTKLAEPDELELDDSDFEILENPAESTPSDDGEERGRRFDFQAPNPDHNRLSIAPTGGPDQDEEEDGDDEVDRAEHSHGDDDEEEDK